MFTQFTNCTVCRCLEIATWN